MLTTTAHNATLNDLRTILTEQHARKVDMVVHSDALTFTNGNLLVEGSDPILGPDGVSMADGIYRPTEVFDEGIAAKFAVPLTYLRRMRAERPDLYDANINGWLQGSTFADPDNRTFTVRAFAGDDGEVGIARSIHSDRYAIMDNLDILVAALDGIRQAGTPIQVTRCDLTDRRMYVRIAAPEIQALAPAMLAGYRSPFNGLTGDHLPMVFAGLVLSNSETGCGAFTIKPQVIVRICGNGATMTKDVVRSVHLGAQQEEGVVRWSSETMQRTVALITSRTKDAVETFLDAEYLADKVEELEEVAGKPVTKPAEVITTVSKKLQFTETERDAIFDMFVRGGQITAGGVMQAVTAAAQTLADPDRGYELENQAVKAMELAAA